MVYNGINPSAKLGRFYKNMYLGGYEYMDYSIQTLFNAEKNCWEVAVSGEVDIFNSQEFKSNLVDLISEKKLNIIINCSELNYMDSTALGALVGVLKNAKSHGLEITLIHVKPNLLKLFKITNLDKVFILEGDDNE